MSYFTQLFRRRARLVHQFFALQVGAVLVVLLLAALHIGHLRLHDSDAAGWGLTFGLIMGGGLFVELARYTELEWPANLWRLIPLGDGARFAWTQLANVTAAAYYLLLEAVVLGPLAAWHGAGFDTNIRLTWPVTLAFIVIGLTTLIWGWCFISLVHLAGLAIAAYLPTNREKFWQSALYLAMTVVLGVAIDRFGDALSLVLGPGIAAGFTFAASQAGTVINFAGHLGALWLLALYFWVMIALMGGGCAWLLSRAVETTQPL